MKRDLDTKGLDGGEDEDAIAIFQSSAAPDALDPQDGYSGGEETSISWKWSLDDEQRLVARAERVLAEYAGEEQ